MIHVCCTEVNESGLRSPLLWISLSYLCSHVSLFDSDRKSNNVEMPSMKYQVFDVAVSKAQDKLPLTQQMAFCSLNVVGVAMGVFQ